MGRVLFCILTGKKLEDTLNLVARGDQRQFGTATASKLRKADSRH
jgi:hypothetical protein